MQVKLQELKPNQLRDFTIDPIDETVVAKLKDSIQEHGFWGGIACRQCDDGTIEIAAGHHRIEAAKQAGIAKADLFVRTDVSDEEMIRLYATENATQRGQSSTALTGTVASALKFLAKDMLFSLTAGSSCQADSQKSLAHMTDGGGIGYTMLLRFLHGIPGINKNGIEQQLANLKASGDYARIITEVEKDIEQEHVAAMEALAEAEREQERLEQEQREAEEQHAKAEQERQEAAALAKTAREEAERTRQEPERQAALLAEQQAEEEAQRADKRREELAEIGNLPKLSQEERSQENCVGIRTQRKLDYLAGHAPPAQARAMEALGGWRRALATVLPDQFYSCE